MGGSKYEKYLVLAQRFVLSNHFRMQQAKTNAPARIVKALGGGGRNCGNEKEGKRDRKNNPGYKGSITIHSLDYDNNTWFNVMTRQQVDKVMKMRKKRKAASLKLKASRFR